MKKIIIIIVVLVALAIAWFLISPAFRVREVQDAFPIGAIPPATTEPDDFGTDAGMPEVGDTLILKRGSFVASAHEVGGTVALIEAPDARILRFENFETIDGPDLRIYLAADTDAKDYVDLGVMRGTRGNITYEVPSSVDTSRYNKVLVWCRAFGVLFSYAELE